MNIVAMSDLHLGSSRSMCRQFLGLLRALPPDTVLVLNGDTIDAERRQVLPEHLKVITAICAESFRRRIVWIVGNHDRNFVPTESNRIEFVTSWSDGKTYFVHGDKFMPAYGLYLLFGQCMRIYRACRIPETLATLKLARSIPLLFRVLKAGSVAKAVRFARKNGYETVVCGHLHTVIDKTVRGVRYVNAGAWTDDCAAFYVSCENGKSRLVKAE